MYKKPNKVVADEGNIKDFSSYKKLCRMNREHSYISLMFLEDPEEPDFVYIKYFRKKSGSIKHTDMIIKKDLEDWISYKKSHGFEIENLTVN